MHGVAQSLSSAGRTVGPMMGGVVYGLGLRGGVVGVVFWGLSVIAIATVGASWFVREGDGWEVLLEGDCREEDGGG